MKVTHYLLLVSAVSLGAQPAQSADFKTLRQAEKISLVLTGKPLSDSMRNQLMQDALSLDDIAESLSKSPEFIENLAAFWTRKIGFQVPINTLDLRNRVTGGSRLYSINRGTDNDYLVVGNAATYTAAVLRRNIDSIKNMSQPRLRLSFCPEGPIIGWNSSISPELLERAANQGIGFDGLPILPDTAELWKEARDVFVPLAAVCGTDYQTVKPWFDPTEVTIAFQYKGFQSYKVVPGILAKCGATLSGCNLQANVTQDRITNMLNRDFTLEPGRLISHVVAEDRPYADILTSKDTIMTGTQAEFLTHFGAALLGNFPNGGYDDMATHPIFKNPRADDSKHYTIQRNDFHAGVLTTVAYQVLTNGPRAKANRAYEAFLCRKFTVPEEAKPDPNDNEPDLAKRTYCAFCHKTLEPMSAFWNRWPPTGDTNFAYNPSLSIDDLGSFNNKQGRGAAAFGSILASTEAFPQCGVQRAFEFVFGRAMTSIEAVNMTESLLAKYNAAGQKMRPIIKALLLSPEFLNGKGE